MLQLPQPAALAVLEECAVFCFGGDSKKQYEGPSGHLYDPSCEMSILVDILADPSAVHLILSAHSAP